VVELFCIVGVWAHGSIFMVRDCYSHLNYNNLLDRVIFGQESYYISFKLVCIFLGFHSFGLYIHNDTMQALGRPQDMFLSAYHYSFCSMDSRFTQQLLETNKPNGHEVFLEIQSLLSSK
jgi:hypothetical protein